MRAKGLGAVISVWLTLSAGGCSDDGITGVLLDQVRTARAAWAAARPAAYDYDLERVCSECGAQERGPVTVEVRGDRVVARTLTAGASPLPEAHAEHFPSVDGLFDLLEDAVERGAEVSARYDPVTGVPLEGRIDYEPLRFGEERAWVVRGGPRTR